MPHLCSPSPRTSCLHGRECPPAARLVKFVRRVRSPRAGGGQTETQPDAGDPANLPRLFQADYGRLAAVRCPRGGTSARRPTGLLAAPSAGSKTGRRAAAPVPLAGNHRAGLRRCRSPSRVNRAGEPPVGGWVKLPRRTMIHSGRGSDAAGAEANRFRGPTPSHSSTRVQETKAGEAGCGGFAPLP
jgi:hypothetical protein